MTKLANDERGNALPAFRWGKCHQLPVTDEPACTEALGFNASVVGILADVDVRVAIGKNPVANEKCARIPANMWVPRRVFPGEKVAVAWCGDEEGQVEITEME